MVDYAQKKYSKISDGYCLSSKVYPHITLCQFEADDQPMIFNENVFNPIFTHADIRNGKGIHKNHSWIEWVVQKDQWLMDLQSSVTGALQSEGVKLTNASAEEYCPHMTFCRIPINRKDNVPLAAIEQSQRPWIFTIGSSDPNGQFLG